MDARRWLPFAEIVRQAIETETEPRKAATEKCCTIMDDFDERVKF